MTALISHHKVDLILILGHLSKNGKEMPYQRTVNGSFLQIEMVLNPRILMLRVYVTQNVLFPLVNYIIKLLIIVSFEICFGLIKKELIINYSF